MLLLSCVHGEQYCSVFLYAWMEERKWYPPRYVWKWHQQVATHWLGHLLWSHGRLFFKWKWVIRVGLHLSPRGETLWLLSQDLAAAVDLLHSLYFVVMHPPGAQVLIYNSIVPCSHKAKVVLSAWDLWRSACSKTQHHKNIITQLYCPNY